MCVCVCVCLPSIMLDEFIDACPPGFFYCASEKRETAENKRRRKTHARLCGVSPPPSLSLFMRGHHHHMLPHTHLARAHIYPSPFYRGRSAAATRRATNTAAAPPSPPPTPLAFSLSTTTNAAQRAAIYEPSVLSLCWSIGRKSPHPPCPPSFDETPPPHPAATLSVCECACVCVRGVVDSLSGFNAAVSEPRARASPFLAGRALCTPAHKNARECSICFYLCV